MFRQILHPDTFSRPDVEFTFNRLGMHKTVDDIVGTRTFAYDKDKLRLASESIVADANGLYSRTITRLYEDENDILRGRYKGLRIGPSESYEYRTTYTYDDSGRIAQVFGNGLDATNGVTYSRLASSELIENVDYGNQVQTQRLPQQHLDLLASVENKVNSTTVSKYQYGVDTLGRRDSVVVTGTAFTGGSGDHHWDFGYNDRNELTGGERWTGAVLGQGTLFALKGDFDYGYDPIGNRETGTTYADMDTTRYSTTYTTNNVNQYTVTSDPAESFTHDEDGDLETDGLFKYAWDAENRLRAVQTKRAGDPVDGDTLVEFKYDYMGRRVEKTYSLRSGTSWVVQPGYPQRFVYDDWNVILVLDGSGDSTRKYTWGLDLSGLSGDGSERGLHGAGGIGGLLAVEETQGALQGAYWYFYDGNGNVGQVIKAGDQSVAARYEYDPYGNIIGPDDDQPNDPGYGDWRDDAGPYALANPIRFSTKWFDAETGLGYWGYRYYSPRLGRWISRDPIGERGGLAILLFVNNCPTLRFDATGQKIATTRPVPDPRTDQDYVCYELPYTIKGTEKQISEIWKSIGGYSKRSIDCESGWEWVQEYLGVVTLEGDEGVLVACFLVRHAPGKDKEVGWDDGATGKKRQRQIRYLHRQTRCIPFPIC